MRDPLRAALNTPADPNLDTDDKLVAAGWVAGLDVLVEMYDTYCVHLRNQYGASDAAAHAQLQSLLHALSGVAWRGSQTEAWIKRHRDEHDPDRTIGSGLAWQALDSMLDDYRDHADVGQPLSDDTGIGPGND